ncbi:MAG: hypothetical protein P9M03_12430 [Candidatus Theseobacter exili]|nr:hypothetical protein [Candidatus Theseobacter exili]
MKKLSEQLTELASRATKLEKNATAAQQENKAKLEARIETAKAETKTMHQTFNARVQSMEAKTSEHWTELKQNFDNRIKQIKQDVDERKDSRDLKRAQKRADRTENNAEAAIYFALYSIAEAEVAVLEALNARAFASSLEENAA